MTNDHNQSKALGTILTPVSLGEIIDKITILEIKVKRLPGEARLNANKELSALNACLAKAGVAIDEEMINQLRKINLNLWETEDRIREKENLKDFGSEFIEIARSVYKQNDQRASIKRLINISYGSELVEEKSYQSY